MVERALIDANIGYVADRAGGVPEGLDFYLPAHDVFIEVKRFHSPRISDQMARAPNVIAAQGETAVRFLCEQLGRLKTVHAVDA